MTEHDRTAFDVFEPFTDTAFQDFLTLHPITSEGIKYILEARLGPSRNVAGTPYNQISDIPCPKMRGNTQAESATNEYPHTLLNIFDPQVLGYFDQPPTLGARQRPALADDHGVADVGVVALVMRVQSMAFGAPQGPSAPIKASLLPMFAHLALVLMAGFYLPAPLVAWIPKGGIQMRAAGHLEPKVVLDWP